MSFLTTLLACTGGCTSIAVLLRTIVREVGQSHRTTRVCDTLDRALALGLAPDAPRHAAAVLAAVRPAVPTPDSARAPVARTLVARAGLARTRDDNDAGGGVPNIRASTTATPHRRAPRQSA